MLRYEKKYLVPYSFLHRLRERIQPFVKDDKYGANKDTSYPQYTVRSIYLDTQNLDCHSEKIEGVELRKKFRIRTYNNFSPDNIAIFEIKRKIENRIQKYKAISKYKHVNKIMETCDIVKYFDNERNNNCLEDAQKFFFHVKKNNLNPTVLVTYEREAYQGVHDPGVRLTFDKNIRSIIYPHFKELYREEGLKHLFPGHFILEVKYFTDEMPSWAKSLLQEFRLRNDALSKYTIGYDIHSPYNIFNY